MIFLILAALLSGGVECSRFSPKQAINNHQDASWSGGTILPGFLPETRADLSNWAKKSQTIDVVVNLADESVKIGWNTGWTIYYPRYTSNLLTTYKKLWSSYAGYTFKIKLNADSKECISIKIKDHDGYSISEVSYYNNEGQIKFKVFDESEASEYRKFAKAIRLFLEAYCSHPDKLINMACDINRLLKLQNIPVLTIPVKLENEKLVVDDVEIDDSQPSLLYDDNANGKTTWSFQCKTGKVDLIINSSMRTVNYNPQLDKYLVTGNITPSPNHNQTELSQAIKLILIKFIQVYCLNKPKSKDFVDKVCAAISNNAQPGSTILKEISIGTDPQKPS